MIHYPRRLPNYPRWEQPYLHNASSWGRLLAIRRQSVFDKVLVKSVIFVLVYRQHLSGYLFIP